MNQINRRDFLSIAASVALAPTVSSAPVIKAIDTHTHFYDPTRPQGVPWPNKNETLLYRPYLPAQFRTLTEKLGVVGTVVVEASPWVEDNQWILDLAKDNPTIVGFIGNLKLGQSEFASHLQRFSQNPLFRGLRLGERAIAEGISQRAFENDLHRLGEQRMTLDVLGGEAMLPNVTRIAKLAPGLRLVIDHLPFNPWDNDLATMRKALAEIAALPNVYAKVSNVVRQKEGKIVSDAAAYRPGLDVLWKLFGADRVIYGSNWPVSERVAPYAIVHKVVAEYCNSKGKSAAEKFFWKNSLAAYSWQARGAAKGL